MTEADGNDAARAQLRGSSVLLTGRVIAAAVNFLTQVLIVRSLTKAGYGAFAYGLSLAILGESAVTFGLDRAVTRFVPIFEERGERAKAVGVLAMVAASIVSLGIALVLVVYGLRHQLGGNVGGGEATTVIVVLAILAPIQSFDNYLIGVFAVFSRASAIFLRRYVLAPSLRLGAVLLLITTGSGASFLAIAYVAAGALGVAVYAGVLVSTLRARGLLSGLRFRELDFPIRETLAFTVPLLSSDLVLVLIESVDAILLGQFRGAAAVAELRAVQPAARFNQLVLSSFGLLYTPLAARLFARGDHHGVRRLYWQTAVWVATLSFPVFALTFAFARPVTVALFGGRYAASAGLLAVLAVGFYVNAAFGFNGLTLNVFGRVREVLVINLLAAGLNLGLHVVLIPRFGAAGAAWATSLTLVAHNALRQVALARSTAVPAFDRSHARVYLAVAGATLAVVAAEWVLSPSLVPAVAIAAAASFLVLVVTRHTLDLADTFPEIARLPVVGSLLAGRK